MRSRKASSRSASADGQAGLVGVGRARRWRRTGRPSSGGPSRMTTSSISANGGGTPLPTAYDVVLWSPSSWNAVSHMPTASKHEVTAERHASSTSSREGSPSARRTIVRASSAIRTRSVRSSRSSASSTSVRATPAYWVEHGELLGSGLAPVERAVDRDQATQDAVVVMERREQHVERVPGVLDVERDGVGDVAVGEDLRADPLVRDEPPHAPVVGARHLLLHRGQRHARPGEAVRDTRRDEDQVVVAAPQRDGRLLEPGQRRHALDQHLQVLTRLVVDQRSDLRRRVPASRLPPLPCAPLPSLRANRDHLHR